jgi:hypothetical protein
VGHRDLQGQRRPVQRKRAPRLLRRRRRHPGTRDRRDLRPLRRPQHRELAEALVSDTRSGCWPPCLNAGAGQGRHARGRPGARPWNRVAGPA